MPRKHYTPEQIINSLGEAEILLSQGNTTAQAVRHPGITEKTYYKKSDGNTIVERFPITLREEYA